MKNIKLILITGFIMIFNQHQTFAMQPKKLTTLDQQLIVDFKSRLESLFNDIKKIFTNNLLRCKIKIVLLPLVISNCRILDNIEPQNALDTFLNQFSNQEQEYLREILKHPETTNADLAEIFNQQPKVLMP